MAEQLDMVRGHTANGVLCTLLVREGTNDGAVCASTFGNDEYRLKGRSFSGWAMDVGCHVGSVTVALAADNPDLHVIAIDAVQDNVRMTALNASANGFDGRVHSVHGAAAPPGVSVATVEYAYTRVSGQSGAFTRENKYIGNVFRPASHDQIDVGIREEVPAFSLKDLLWMYDVDELTFMKIDCEGGEWGFLSDPAVARVQEIIGEWHDRPFSAVVDLLRTSHHVEKLHEEGNGALGLFRATRLDKYTRENGI